MDVIRFIDQLGCGLTSVNSTRIRPRTISRQAQRPFLFRRNSRFMQPLSLWTRSFRSPIVRFMPQPLYHSITRREFIQTTTAATLSAALASTTLPAAEKPAEKMIGLQIGAVSFADEGIEA